MGFKVAQSMFSIFAGERDSGTEHTLSEFAHNTKLWGAVNMPEGRDAIQMDMDRPESWHLMKLNKGQGNPRPMSRLGREVTEQPCREGLWGDG